MEHLIEIGIFTGKALVIAVALAGVLIVIANLIVRMRPPRERLEVENLNERFQAFADTIQEVTHDPKDLKAELKKRRKQEKRDKKIVAGHKKVYVIDFVGDIRASQVDSLRDEVTALLGVADPLRDEVVVRLESTGGMVHTYGLAAAQLLRIKERKIKLTICVDRVAASGGYMMACTADQLLAAPFAILGSIGVIAQVPNLHRVLKKHDIDYEEITAGEFKRTVSMLAEITDKGRQKFLEQIEDTHLLFKEFVQRMRPQLDLPKIATGEHWFGHRALELRLVDRLVSSDDYLFDQRNDSKILHIKVVTPKTLSEKLAGGLGRVLQNGVNQWWQKVHDEHVLGRNP